MIYLVGKKSKTIHIIFTPKKVFKPYQKKNPNTKIRLIGHSLGTEVILSAIKKLAYSSKNQGIVESVYFFGSSLPSDILGIKKYGKVLKQSHKDGSIKNPLGYLGITGKTIPKIIQIRVYPKNHRFVSYVTMLKSFP